ncbi:UDP-3-O-acyl-N-acetylglucosamine deacetylase [Synechococcus sp. M16CYN]|uniref:UDP-3-O-acyl-N-acetylglucosamine deacetylase n=1 Tax=Synechococcus sp. M16CYN TaxID=3103139 RepID=UPI0033407677
MITWPEDYSGAWTLAGQSERSGVGLHSGLTSVVQLRGADQPGFYLKVEGHADPFRLVPSQVCNSQLCTTLNLGPCKVATVEHLLAALAGCGLTHVEIRLSGNEIPLLDGSALDWTEAIAEAGLKPAETPRLAAPELNQPLLRHRGGGVIMATPAETFSLFGVIDFPQPAIGRQQLALEMTPRRFIEEIAPARTFGFSNQVNQLRAAGLIKGGNLDNALVCNGDGWVNPPLRFPNEPVRHKLLDLIGDLALVGFPKAKVFVYRGSHELHTDFAASL